MNVFGQTRAMSSALADQFARAFDECGQDLERAAAEANGRFILQQQLLRR